MSKLDNSPTPSTASTTPTTPTTPDTHAYILSNDIAHTIFHKPVLPKMPSLVDTTTSFTAPKYKRSSSSTSDSYSSTSSSNVLSLPNSSLSPHVSASSLPVNGHNPPNSLFYFPSLHNFMDLTDLNSPVDFYAMDRSPPFEIVGVQNTDIYSSMGTLHSPFFSYDDGLWQMLPSRSRANHAESIAKAILTTAYNLIILMLTCGVSQSDMEYGIERYPLFSKRYAQIGEGKYKHLLKVNKDDKFQVAKSGQSQNHSAQNSISNNGSVKPIVVDGVLLKRADRVPSDFEYGVGVRRCLGIRDSIGHSNSSSSINSSSGSNSISGGSSRSVLNFMGVSNKKVVPSVIDENENESVCESSGAMEEEENVKELTRMLNCSGGGVISLKRERQQEIFDYVPKPLPMGGMKGNGAKNNKKPCLSKSLTFFEEVRIIVYCNSAYKGKPNCELWVSKDIIKKNKMEHRKEKERVCKSKKQARDSVEMSYQRR